MLFFSGFAVAAADIAATITVTKVADTADGVCDADCSLREAVFASNSGDTIVFSPLFNLPQTILLTGGQIAINKSLTIAGPNADLLAVSGNNAGRIFYISNGATVTLAAMKLKDGRVDTIDENIGGAIFLLDSTLTLTSMTLTDNMARYTGQQPSAVFGTGGAIYSHNSTLSINNSTINNNTAPSAGGIYSRIGIVEIINSKINDNSGSGVIGFENEIINVINSTFNGNSGRAIAGLNGRISLINSTVTNNRSGGISNDDFQAILTIDRSIISNNSSLNFAGTVGGGVLNKGIATISNTSINHNRVSGDGGGVFNTGTMNLINSTVSNNEALKSGGGIFNAVGQLYLTNSTVSGNVADFGGGFGNSPGGGIYNGSLFGGGSIILTNSTIANNRSTGLGGGLYHDFSGTVTIRNTIIAGNFSSRGRVDVSGIFVSQGFNLIGNTADSSGWTASDLLNRNPLLASLGNNDGPTLTHALMLMSPAINAGSNTLAVDPTTNLGFQRDQRGYGRRVGGGMGGIVDIGAYESNIADSPVRLNGRILTASGRGVFNARIALTDSNGTVIYAHTNPFGYYRFVNLPPGTTYTISIIHKHHRFNSPQTVTVDSNRSDLNFIASL